MPGLRTRSTKQESRQEPKKSPYFKNKKIVVQTFVAMDDNIDTMVDFPDTLAKREAYINPKNKRKVTPFQFKVYELCAQIPKGQVSTYKHISDALNSSPRAVGQALRLNPFAPLPVPCHRVIATDFAIGGFSGSWGDSQLVADKKAKLTREGCKFDEYVFTANGDGTRAVFTDFKVKA